MKRVLIRMSALATVVVLGLIAIAQAQRSANHSTAVAGGASATADPPESLEPARPLADSGVPRPLPMPSHANPLRQESSFAASEEGRPTSRLTGRTYPPESRDSSEGVRPLVLSGPDPTMIAATGGTSPLTAPPSAPAEVPSSPQAPTQLFPTRPSAAPTPATRSAEPTAEPLPATDPFSRPAQGNTALVPVGPAPAEREPRALRSEPAASEPSPLRANPYSRNMSEPGSPSTSAPQAPAIAAPNNVLRETTEPDRLSTFDDRVSPLDSSPQGTGTGTPGNKQLEGAQSPQVTVEKTAPAEIQVGKPATFRIRVRNSGKVAAHGVEIHDEVPRGTRLMTTSPQASRGVRGELVWSLGTMQPGDESTAEVQLMPVEEGEIGSVATVHFRAEATARAIATKPELVVETSAPSQVLVGEPVLLNVTVTNPGSGVATGVVLEERIPAGLQHPAGTELTYDVGQLKPKESRKLQLQMVAERPGQVSNVLVARGDGNLKAEHRLDLQILAPQLGLAIEGPKRRYLEREAAYTVAITNPGTAPAQRVELTAQLPPGLKFVSANNAGHYVQAEHAVHWQLDELPVQETGTLKLVTMPVEPGEHKLLVSASADKGVSAEREQSVLIEGIAAIMFEVVDVNDPVEKGGETTYEIRVVNQGSKAATNVQLVLNLPTGMRPVAAEGPTHHAMGTNQIVFEGLSRLAPKADTTYRVRVQCLQPGDLRMQAQLMTNEIREPVTKEESTRVYADE